MADGFGKRRPFILVGKTVLLFVGFFAEVLGKFFHFYPVFDRKIARTAVAREYYSSRKIEKTLGFKFISIEDCIHKICYFRLQNNE